MHYYKAEFIIDCKEEQKTIARELLADIAGEAGFESFEDTEQGLDGYVQIDFLDSEALNQGIENFPLEEIKITYALACVIDEDWNQEWESIGFDPIDIDGQMLIFDAKKPIPEISYPINIGIEAKNAFGTGTHETTRMILSQLMGMDLKDKRILDCGCGTGILGIAASKLGAEDIIAYDIDEWSVRNTSHNATLNGVNNMYVVEGDSSVLSHISGVFDVVLANINRNILLADMHAFKDVMNVGAKMIISGFYEDDAQMLIDKASELGMKEIARKTDSNWCLLMFE